MYRYKIEFDLPHDMDGSQVLDRIIALATELGEQACVDNWPEEAPDGPTGLTDEQADAIEQSCSVVEVPYDKVTFVVLT